MTPKKIPRCHGAVVIGLLILCPALRAAELSPSSLPPLPPALTIPKPGPVTDTPYRSIDWMRDLGFTGKPGVETQAAKDVAANLTRAERMPGGGRGGQGAPGAESSPGTATTTPPSTVAPK